MESATLRVAERGIVTIPKEMREQYDLHTGAPCTLIDLGGVFVLSTRQSEIDAVADRIASRWAQDGRSLDSMLRALSEE